MRNDIDARKEEIIARLRAGVPRLEICRDLGCKYDTLKSRLVKWGVTLKNPARKGVPHVESQLTRELLSERWLKLGTAVGSHKLKLWLWKFGLKPKSCETCGWAEVSVDGRVPLELDHINGDHYDNRLENLQILCPNHHALKPGNSGAGQKHKRV